MKCWWEWRQIDVCFVGSKCVFLSEQLNAKSTWLNLRLLDSSLVLYESYIWILNNRDFLKLKSENSFLSFWQQNYFENIFLTIFLAQRVSKSRIYPKNAVKQKVNSDEFMDFFLEYSRIAIFWDFPFLENLEQKSCHRGLHQFLFLRAIF